MHNTLTLICGENIPHMTLTCGTAKSALRLLANHPTPPHTLTREHAIWWTVPKVSLRNCVTPARNIAAPFRPSKHYVYWRTTEPHPTRVFANTPFEPLRTLIGEHAHLRALFVPRGHEAVEDTENTRRVKTQRRWGVGQLVSWATRPHVFFFINCVHKLRHA